MSKKTWILISCLVLSLTLGLGGSLAYLTDTDTKVNTFTMGNVKIEVEENFPNKELRPGMEVTKEAKITNKGTNPAYVWMTVAIPDEVKDFVLPLWATGVVEYTADGVPTETTDVSGNKYKLYTVLVDDNGQALQPGASTQNLLGKIKMTGNVDYEDGKFYKVEAGVRTPINYDLNKLSVVVTGYAIQADGFGNVVEAYNAYNNQWGDSATSLNGTIIASPEAGATRPAGYAPKTEGDTIDGMVITDASDDGTNLRALYKNGMTGNLSISNSHLDGTYAMNVTTAAEATGLKLTANNTTFAGWVSYSGWETASFTGCIFQANSNPEIYNNIRPYDTTTFVNCEFKDTTLWLDKLAEGDTITFEKCTYNGAPLNENNRPDIPEGAGNYNKIIFK